MRVLLTKSLVIVFCCSFFYFSFLVCNKTEHNSQSFMFTRPCYYRVSADKVLWMQFFKNNDEKGKFAAQITQFYQRSINSDEVSRYFLPNNTKNIFTVRGASASDFADCDIHAKWLGIDNADFMGDFTVNPKQKQGGIKAEVIYDLKKIFSSGFLSSFWIGASAPIIFVENDLQLSQCFVSNLGSTEEKDIVTALDQSSWSYSRFKQDATFSYGLPEVKLKVGTVLLAKDSFYVGSSTSLVLPFHKGQDPKYLFDPVVGFNEHIGIGNTINFQINLAEEGSVNDICFFLNAENIYFIPNTQYRTLDLKEKPWSRFLLLRKSGEVSTTPGVNVLTQEVKVKPYNFADVSGGFRFKTEHVHLEAGYSLWGHGDETLSLKNTFAEVYGIASDTEGASLNASTISTSATTVDGSFTTIKATDLDLTSGASKAGFTHQIHASLGCVNKGRETDNFFGLGFFVEIPHQNTAMHLWGFWVKVGTAF